ncbi:hypothetical protein COM13_21090 [Bacillus pseudomycoides]|nr:hypothetical protein COO07_20300 [Bacillus pseudomycoides]PEE04047.1 hypothetical protein CON86_22410 [Bacillus pseudomycoides]PEK78939.1 hypothetical protein CN597_14560 [Bacillus pseudomycoides]PEM65457.1 hypothetical protein CN632_29935 [Bacillus pseudomycoides]PEN10112.1 hypothetical protein CN640_09605 [Bacillus pseudomycoides]
MNFNNYWLLPKHCSSFTNLFMLFSNFATEPSIFIFIGQMSTPKSMDAPSTLWRCGDYPYRACI